MNKLSELAKARTISEEAKAAKDGTVPADLAIVTEEPRAQIASDLSEYVNS